MDKGAKIFMIKDIEKKIEFFMTEAKRRNYMVTRTPWGIKIEQINGFMFMCVTLYDIDRCETYTKLKYLLNDIEFAFMHNMKSKFKKWNDEAIYLRTGYYNEK